MKKILFIISIFFLGWNTTTQAQEEAVFMHYMINPLLINPAAAGFDQTQHNVFMNVRSAWANFPETPNTYSLNYNGPIGRRLGIGAMIYSENIASLSRFRGQLSYAVRFDIEDLKMSAGLSTEYHVMRLDNNALNNELIEQGDASIEEAMDGLREFDASIGVYGKYTENFYFGVALPNLIRSRLDRINEVESSFNYLVNIGGAFELPDSKIKLQPSILAKKVRNVDFQVDLNMLASFLNEQLITGLSYRGGTGSSLGIILGTKYNALRFIYSYDVYLDQFQQYNGGTHEVSINLQFKSGKGNYDRSRKYRR